jgi:hypothetical protein
LRGPGIFALVHFESTMYTGMGLSVLRFSTC